MSRTRPVAAGRSRLAPSAVLVLALALALPACSLLRPEEPSVAVPSIEGGSPGGPHALAAASVSVWSLPEALAGAGLGLRVAEGERGDLRLRYAAVPAADGEDFDRRLGVAPWAYSPRAPFGGRGDLTVSAMRGTPPRGFSLTVRPREDGGGLAALDIVALSRPEDGSLLPAIRGRVPVAGPGRILVVGESREALVFAAVLDVATPGASPAPAAGHALSLSVWQTDTEDLARVLRNAGILDTAGPGGFAARPVTAAEAAGLGAALDETGTALDGARVSFTPGRPLALSAGPVRLEVVPGFRLADYRYEHRIAVLNREGVPPLAAPQPERDSVLVLAFDALAPGLSLAALLAATPGR